MPRRAPGVAVTAAMVLVLCYAACPARASAPPALEVTLQPATQNPAHLPYQTATLRVVNPGGTTVEGLTYRLAEGGPTFVDSEAAFPPGQTELAVPVPALAVRQQVDVTVGSRGEGPAHSERVPLGWPAPRVRTDPFYDVTAYEDWGLRLGRWPGRTRWTVLAVLAGMAAVVSALTAIGRSGTRVAIVGALVAGVSVGMWLWLDRPVVHSQRDPSRPIVIYTTRRTSEVTGEGLPWPIYWGERHFQADAMTVSLRGGWTAPIKPREARVFRLRPPVPTQP